MAVYFIRAGADGPVKIGYAINPANRVAALQTGQPETLTMLRVMEGDRYFESALHRHFAYLRTRGEWFSYSNEMLGDLEFLRAPEADSEPGAGSEPPYEVTNMTLDRWLTEVGMTDADFARQSGVGTRAAVGNYRHGLRFPRWQTMVLIRDFTDGAVTANGCLDGYFEQRAKRGKRAKHRPTPTNATPPPPVPSEAA